MPLNNLRIVTMVDTKLAAMREKLFRGHNPVLMSHIYFRFSLILFVTNEVRARIYNLLNSTK
jgi:hypothetical protein